MKKKGVREGAGKKAVRKKKMQKKAKGRQGVQRWTYGEVELVVFLGSEVLQELLPPLACVQIQLLDDCTHVSLIVSAHSG